MKKLIALLLLSPIAQAEYQDELYEGLKDKLTHVVCKASGQRSTTIGTYTDPSQVKETDYFSFDDFGFLWARLKKFDYLNVLIQVPDLEESGKFKQFNDNGMFNVFAFNEDSITIHFEADKELLETISRNGIEYKRKSQKWFIDRNSGNYTATSDSSMNVPIGELTELGNTTEKLSGSCELYDPSKKKF